VRRYGVVKLSRRPLESPKGLSVWDTAVQGGEVGGAEGGVVLLGAHGLVVVAAWMAWMLTGAMASGLLCRASSAIVT
jgi:hypothetical protein